MGAFDTDKAIHSEHNSDDPQADARVNTVMEASPVERIFMVQAQEIRNRLDRIGQTAQATQYLIAVGLVVVAVVALRLSKGKIGGSV